MTFALIVSEDYKVRFNPRSYYLDHRVAESYDNIRFKSISGRIFDHFEKKAIGKALRLTPAGSAVLEVPCGTGRITEYLLRSHFKVTAVDISPAMIAVAAKKLQPFGRQVSFKVGDLAGLKVAAETYSCAVSIRFLSHFNAGERVAFLKNLSRFSSQVVIGVSYSNPWYRFRRLLKKFARCARPIQYPLDESSLLRELTESNLEIVERFSPLSFLSEELILLLKKKD
jgi:ubiquinone/menaquinone biosynthesis C-methylase UbiE